MLSVLPVCLVYSWLITILRGFTLTSISSLLFTSKCMYVVIFSLFRIPYFLIYFISMYSNLDFLTYSLPTIFKTYPTLLGRSKKAEVNISTVGVDVCDWMYPKKTDFAFGRADNRTIIKFSTWDFGGQVRLGNFDHREHTLLLNRNERVNKEMKRTNSSPLSPVVLTRSYCRENRYLQVLHSTVALNSYLGFSALCKIFFLLYV